MRKSPTPENAARRVPAARWDPEDGTVFYGRAQDMGHEGEPLAHPDAWGVAFNSPDVPGARLIAWTYIVRQDCSDAGYNDLNRIWRRWDHVTADTSMSAWEEAPEMSHGDSWDLGNVADQASRIATEIAARSHRVDAHVGTNHGFAWDGTPA